MSKIALKKYVEDNLEFNLEYYLNHIGHEFALNWIDKNRVNSKVTAHQYITIKKDFIELKAKTMITVLGVGISEDFVERILTNLPIFERKEPLIVELAKAISKELQKLELKKNEYISSLSISTSSADNLKRLEDLYNINTAYELGVKLRQNILIAREITRFSTFNFAYILKMCELFELGEVLDIINDKENKTITIILENNINNIASLQEFLNHMNELSIAFYEVVVKNV